MRALLLCLVVVFVGCKKSAPAVVDAGAAVAPVVAPPPKELTAPSTLSLFEPVGEKCEWRQVDPVSGDKIVLASFPGSCVGARVSFSPDASKAVIWFDPKLVQSAGYGTQVSSKPGFPDEEVDEKASPRAYVVPVKRPQVEPLPLPAIGSLTLEELGVDGTGAVLALLMEELPEAEVAKGKITSGGQTFDLSTISEGLPVLVHAYRREGKDWKKLETKLSTTGWDYGLGVKELDAFGKLGPRSVELAASHAQGDSAEPADVAKLMKLAPKGASADDGSWIFVGAGGARVFVWEITGEFAHTTGLVAVGEKVLPGLGFTDGDLVAIRSSSAYLLVTASTVGAHPRLYSMPDAKLVFSSDSARAVTFWPSTSKPETHEAMH